MGSVQIFIVDDHPIIRQALRSLLEWEPDLAVCGEAATAAEALEVVALARPDLVLIDVSLPDMSGIELARALRVRHPALPLVMLSAHEECFYAERALEAGARAYVVKRRAAELPAALRQILGGEQYLSAERGS